MSIMSIFKEKFWYDRRYDGRRKEFRGISREFFEAAKKAHWDRAWAKVYLHKRGEDLIKNCAIRRELIAYFATIPYEYQGDGLDDFNLFQRPSSNGRGYVAICPGEPRNNYYTEDPILVGYLKKKYNKYNNK